MSARTPQVKDKGKRAKKLDDEKEKELMDYLKKHFFLDKFKESVKEMIDMDPNLPKDPVKYIKNNIDYTYKEAREVERELKMTKKAIAKFEEENAILKYQLELYEPSGDGETRPDTPRKSQEDEDDAKEEEEEEDEGVDDEGELDLEFDELEEELGVEDEEAEGASAEGGNEEVVQEEAVAEEEQEEEEDDKEEELPESEDDPCTCIQGYMFPFPPEEFEYPLNADGKPTKY
ncbi:hypothetical protein GE061_017754 [Apolygus lucorum]|uniref:Uncharacterized protein n=1 Tax=Apolygus lucorum TaxID=248454 RepID=A0A8S9XDZ6_APOLU|nr:hypothetical protein GE061_017754 [Apolygus lucorum]